MQTFFNQPVKNNLRTYDNIRKIVTSQADNYFNKYYKMIAIDLSKQQALDADPKVIQEINFTGNLNRGEDVNDKTTMFFIIEEA